MYRNLIPYLLVLSPLWLMAQEPCQSNAQLLIDQPEGPAPWSSLELNNAPCQFQFAIVTDRTGGHRPGVFEKGIRKLNLLQPEFVLSVGDLIEGYTEDTVELIRQWEEFDGFIEQLQAPFFYVPGNHDITNPVMEKLWQQRLGPTYYHFVYKDVLFLCLNSEETIQGAGRGAIADEQYDWIRQTLADHADVKWTLLFMHQPLWVQDADPQRWFDVEQLLAGRQHTVFVGHRHHYVKYERNNNEYFMLATTGGGSSLRGPQMGEFDHVVWVTMTDEGPIIANLQLEGIHNKDLVTEEVDAYLNAIRTASPIRPEPLFAQGPIEEKETLKLRLTNDRDVPMFVQLEDRFSWDFETALETDTILVNPNSVEFAELTIRARNASVGINQAGVNLKAAVSYREPNAPELSYPFEFKLGPVRKYTLSNTDEDITIDANLNEWETLPYDLQTDDPEDCSARFDIRKKGDFLYLAAMVTDDNIQSDTGIVSWQQDYIAFTLNGDPLATSALNTGTGWYRESLTYNITPGTSSMPASTFYEDRYPANYVEWACEAVAGGYALEAKIPVQYIIDRQGPAWNTFRFNLGLQDKDAGEEATPRYSWQVDWRSSGNLVGSGMFFRER